jgi:glycosyltransferase involved in cell wall biosynthesis
MAAGLVRSLWGTTPIINLIAAVRADRLAGAQAESLVMSTYHVTEKFDLVLKRQIDELSRSDPSLQAAFRWLVFIWALIEYDNFYYFNDCGILIPNGGYGSDRFGINLEEMQLLKRANKRLFTLCYGADYRTRKKTLASGKFNFCMDCPAIGKFCLCDDTAGEQVFATISKYATRMLASGLSRDYVPGGRQLDYVVLDTDAVVPKMAPVSSGDRLRVVHVPNHPHFKGTRYLEGAVARLTQEGYPVDLVMASGLPHEEAIELMRSADVVVDQLIGGNIGLTALEAMALGKPVISYVRDPGRVLAHADSCPVINANPDSIYNVLREFAAGPRVLVEIGKTSREYVVQQHSIPALAERLRNLYSETAEFAPAVHKTPIRTRSYEVACRAVYAAAYRLYVARRALGRARASALKVVLSGGKTVARLLIWICSPALVYLARIATSRRMRSGTPRTLWGVTPILTLSKLAACDRLLGFKSSSLVYQTYHVTSDFDITLKRVQERILAACPYLYRPFTWLVLAYVLLRFDIVHLFCDRGVVVPRGRIGIHPREMELLRRAGKELYTYTYGADVRTRSRTLALGAYNFCMHCPKPGHYCVCDDEAGAANINVIRRAATRMVAMGDMRAYVPDAEDLHFWPLDLAKIEYAAVAPLTDRPLRVAHAPNHPHFKGTSYLEDAIARLHKDGIPIDLVLVQGVPNSEVLSIFRSVDLVAEQFIGGFHGYTALEAMATGRPVISYLRGPDMAINASECPILNANPETLYDVLRDCARGRYDLVKIGLAGRRYVERYYSIEAVAARLGRLYLRTAALPAPLRARIEERVRVLEASLPSALATGEIASKQSGFNLRPHEQAMGIVQT